MKIEEAVRILDPATTTAALYGLPHDEAVALVEDACRLAVAALHEKLGEAVDACNQAVASICEKLGAAEEQPLTLEELRKMDGQPVWIEFIPDADGEQLKMWALVSVDENDGEVFLLNSIGGSSAYEEVWADIRAIYRRPPVEAGNV